MATSVARGRGWCVCGERGRVVSHRSATIARAVVLPPESREEAVRQARTALNVGLGRRSDAKGSSEKSVLKRISRGTKRLIVDFPLQKESPDTVAELASELLDGVTSEKTVLCFGTRGASDSAKALNLANCYHVEESIPKKLKASSLVLVGVDESQAGLLLGSSRWSSVIAINPKGFTEGKLGGTFDTAYQFLPLLVQGFLGFNAEGALLKCLSDSPEGSNWDIFVKDGATFRRVASQATKPDQDELELALYNNVAENNPLIKGFKAVKGMFSKD
ncbi:DUF1995 domain-containing protein [Chloropicon primus]|uniref:DUF1995 domain-containing protein n=1 Tax=Chloropicon primus TaxID=1764295 RepID=A0A5B8MMS5_9CHLO|nr:hypothetical protein A3770_06p43740 [Chloropicon primus]UPR01076.1 DUF1995 domain-containing protein [Chloropicon primus]|eukprot:QDZ21856.1 hypothetical protein A3770_06p43740 [Chloropicon primus]